MSQEPPRTRADCLEGGSNAARPCPWSSCRHWLPGGLGCVLDEVAKKGNLTLEECGAGLLVTRERTRQIEASALAHLRRFLPAGPGGPHGRLLRGMFWGDERPTVDEHLPEPRYKPKPRYSPEQLARRQQQELARKAKIAKLAARRARQRDWARAAYARNGDTIRARANARRAARRAGLPIPSWPRAWPEVDEATLAERKARKRQNQARWAREKAAARAAARQAEPSSTRAIEPEPEQGAA